MKERKRQRSSKTKIGSLKEIQDRGILGYTNQKSNRREKTQINQIRDEKVESRTNKK